MRCHCLLHQGDLLSLMFENTIFCFLNLCLSTADLQITFTFHFHALEKEMAAHSSVLTWRIPGTGEPGGLPSMGSHRIGHKWSDLAAAAVPLYPRAPHLLLQAYFLDPSAAFLKIQPSALFCARVSQETSSLPQPNPHASPLSWPRFQCCQHYLNALQIWDIST